MCHAVTIWLWDSAAASDAAWTLVCALAAQAFGVALAGEKGWSLVFSGDTRPCAAVTAAAKNATILIHEVRSAEPGVAAWH
jgi:hypothetical protein